jgi:UDP-3-O-[3-hydroxymyristoyl] glucosamine N-acyltransferase
MHISVEQIVLEFAERGLSARSASSSPAILSRVAALEECRAGDLVFMDKAAGAEHVRARRPAAVVTTAALGATLQCEPDTVVLIARNVPLMHALIKQKYAGRDYTASGWECVHPSAVIHPTALLDPSVIVEPRVVIGRNVRIGAGSRIMAGVVIENDAVLGENCFVHPSVVIGYGCLVGNDVEIGSGSVIGSEGFGFAQDAMRKSHGIPQTGIVVIGDRVRIGANNCIDRATYRETRIGAGTKFDNLCHVAHNVTIGEDCLLTAMLCVAGSTRIGNRVTTSGQTGISDHVDICDDVVLVHRAGVVKNIVAAGVHAALPAQPLDLYLKNTAAARTGNDLRKRVAELERALAQR